jgi:hypothetical protein
MRSEASEQYPSFQDPVAKNGKREHQPTFRSSFWKLASEPVYIAEIAISSAL